MPLAIGNRIGPYEITGTLGAGGMGEVYRARDTKLGRDVALKVISDAFALDPDRLARFHREAQVLASLNHPHIGAIHGFEDSGETHALVLELVDGETLADRISRGPIPLEEALPIARQIAEALEAAHERGIVHRDLKPANTKITPDGSVKVLDFGLAKLNDPNVSSGPNAANGVSQSPTIMSPAMMTGVGVLLGTAAYMSPEQAKGREADKRSDIWAFGCVLYEMLTARRAFDGEDMTEVLGAVVRLEPNWQALPSDVPQPVRTLLQRCLIKDRRTRIGDIAAALFVLDHEAAAGPMIAAPLRPAALWRRTMALTAGALLVAFLGGALVWFVTRPASPRVARFTIASAGREAVAVNVANPGLAITTDGTQVIYVGNNGTQLFVRSLDQLEPRAIATGNGLRATVVSPDGQWVGFVDGASILKKVAMTGGPAETIAQMDGASRGITWGPDDAIIFATASPATGLQRVSAAGGAPMVLTTPNLERGENDHLWPELLPGGKAVLYTTLEDGSRIQNENGQIAVLDLQTGASKILIRGGSGAHYVTTGHLVYSVAGALHAVRFDLEQLAVVGRSARVLESVATAAFGAAHVAVASSGSLVYISSAGGDGGPQAIVSVDRQGRTSPLAGLPPDAYRDVRVSPDGSRLALTIGDDIWTYDFIGSRLSRLTTHPAGDHSPLWTPDGKRIVFTSRRVGYPELFSRLADGSGSDEGFLTRTKDLTDLRANGWSADGKQVLLTEVSAASAVVQVAIEGPAEARVLVKSDSPVAVSPDGRWIAYQSNVSGRFEIYVERYPDLGNRQPISTDGGSRPLWSRDGRELFFSSLDGRHILAAAIQSGTTLVAGRPQELFESAMLVPVRGNRPYDLTHDGRFVIIRSGPADPGGGTAPQLVMVQNWFEELKRLVPVN